MKLSEARKRREYIEQGVQSLPDASALECPELHPAWNPAGDYAAGTRVCYDGVLFKCLQPHTAQANWNPAAAPSLWAEVLIPDPEAIPEWKQPNSTNPYQIGDKVRHNGKTWENTVRDNVWEPGVYGWVESE